MELLTALKNKFEYSEDEAREEMREMRRRIFRDGENPESILEDYGLEPDYVFDLLF